MSIKKIGKWEIKEELGKGGNGLVFRAVADRDEAAIKILRNPKRIERFKDEIEGMRRLKGTPGVLPLIDFWIPENPSRSDPAWFAMPLAEPLTDALGEHSGPKEIVSAIKDITLVLAEIHRNGFSHRDIKPDNLFKFKEHWSVGDFGFIEFEGKSHQTAPGEKIGPMHFIAPEMLLGVEGSDGKLADVFSIAKTLWVLLSGANFPIPGSYDASSDIYKLKSYVSLERSIELDTLIQQCTAADPNDRPTMSDVAKELLAWVEIENGSIGKNGASHDKPNGAEWLKVVEAGKSQKLASKKHNDLHSETHAAINGLYNDLKLFYSDIKADLESNGLEVGGIQGTMPPGVSIRFPEKSSPEARLEMDFRVWLQGNWDNLGKRVITGMALCRMRPSSKEPFKELYKLEEKFVIDGPAGMKFVESVKADARSLLNSWLEACAKEWDLLP